MAKQRKKHLVFSKIIGLTLLFTTIMFFCYELWIYPSLLEPTTLCEAQYPDVIDTIPVITRIIKENAQNRPGIKRQIRYIIIHETGNKKVGANASAHSDYLMKKSTEVSWHYTVDSEQIYHNLPDDEVGWHASDGLNDPGGNLNGIGIELCVNKDGDFEKTFDHAALLCAYLMHAYHLSTDDIQQHSLYAKKCCPEIIQKNGRWDEFIKRCQSYYDNFYLQ